jgi:hypothetical protein
MWNALANRRETCGKNRGLRRRERNAFVEDAGNVRLFRRCWDEVGEMITVEAVVLIQGGTDL